MLLYHGSNTAVNNPKVIISDRRLDFGAGFYLTSSYEQANRWAELTVLRREDGRPTISSFSFDAGEAHGLSVLKFEKADEDWLKFVVSNRNTDRLPCDFDIVIGPVANDRTMPVIKLYFAGVYDEKETIRRLLTQNLKDQYAFKTEKALKTLTLNEVICP